MRQSRVVLHRLGTLRLVFELFGLRYRLRDIPRTSPDENSSCRSTEIRRDITGGSWGPCVGVAIVLSGYAYNGGPLGEARDKRVCSRLNDYNTCIRHDYNTNHHGRTGQCPHLPYPHLCPQHHSRFIKYASVLSTRIVDELREAISWVCGRTSPVD